MGDDQQMTKTNREQYYNVSRLVALQPLLRSPIVALGVHWVFQGILYMDRTERLFKIGVELVIASILFFFALIAGFKLIWAVVVSFLLAHTINWLVNSQIWVVMKHFKMVRHTRDEFDRYIGSLKRRIGKEPSITWGAAFGSLARGEWNEYSDLDVRLVHKPGLQNSVRACWFVMKERSRAFAQRFPLDIYLLDDFSRSLELRPDEYPVHLK